MCAHCKRERAHLRLKWLVVSISIFFDIRPMRLPVKVWGGRNYKIFQLFIKLWGKYFSVFDPIPKTSTITLSAKTFGSLPLSSLPQFDLLPCNVLVNQEVCFLGLKCHGGQKVFPWTFPSIRFWNSVKFLSPSSKSSKKQRILFQKSTELESETKSFFHTQNI